MADKKRKRPLTNVTAAERERQFPNDLYEDSGVLFCRVCVHSLDFTWIDTVKDHLKSKKHLRQSEIDRVKRASGSGPTKCQATLDKVFAGTKSKVMRENFILDFTKMCTVADIPLDKTEKMRPFIKKHCSQGGALPQAASLREIIYTSLICLLLILMH